MNFAMTHYRFSSNLLLSLCLLLLSACDDYLHSDFPDISPAEHYQATTIINRLPATTTTPTVMTWNIKFGGARIDFFFDCFGNRVLMTENEVLTNMKAVANRIRLINPDIIYLQEVDIRSKRSAYINQMQYLLDNTDLNYGVYASQWRSDFVPSDGIGPIDSGNAILSKWPITNATRHSLPLIAEQDSLTQYFYLRRNYIKAQTIPDGSTTLHMIASHTSAYASDNTKQRQLQIIHNAAKNLNDAGHAVLVGGDFNTLPPGELMRSGFADVVCTDPDFTGGDYSNEGTWIQPFYTTFNPAIVSPENNAAHYTYSAEPASTPPTLNRKLDYLFTNGTFNPGTTDQTAVQLSDHVPVYTTVQAY
ncbi:MAG: endonuclease/exonuclease/phosphatase family protein [Gammaproteobacteria bacterium]|nr:endonuclease/exonuclease/phosphatase family protein [Gammaproteobacteria bacterium]